MLTYDDRIDLEQHHKANHAYPHVTREHWIEIYGGGSYKRGIEWLRERGLCVVRCNGCERECFGWKTETKGST